MQEQGEEMKKKKQNRFIIFLGRKGEQEHNKGRFTSVFLKI